MAAESMLSIVKSLHTAEQSWCIWLKEMGAGDYQQTANCLFAAILGWLGQRSIESLIASVAPPSELILYLKFSLSKYVSYVLSYSAGIFTKYNRFPYQEDTINQWFTHSAERVKRDQAVNIINVDREGQRRKYYKTQNQADDFPQSLEDYELEVFFHGTSHRSAKDIIEGGINLQRGEEKKDFSDHDGFYVGKSFDEASTWAIDKHHSSAVLVFRVNRNEFGLRGDYNGLDLQNRVSEWQDVISQFRSGKPDPMYQNYHFIEGPMASVSRRNPRLDYPVQKCGSYQLCVRNVDCAELFDRSLHSVVFFDR